MRTLQTSPTRVTQHVRRLRKQIPNSSDPVLVSVQPRRGSRLRDCFQDVAAQVSEKGGGIQHGWAIWEWSDVMIEGEFHAVWKSPEGELIDVSPKETGEKQIMFIPDTKRIFRDFPVDNIRIPIACDWRLDEYIRLKKEFYKHKCEAGKNVEFGEMIVIGEAGAKANYEADKLELELMRRYPG